ncbi:MAG TPA: SDR family oxidoreductase [Novosphingobium sp.]|nr:SDR family oxidoreductase [Novosphingobium sp.]
MNIPIEMAGKAVIVTGAASGLGRTTAVKFAETGANLCIADIHRDGLAETEAMLGSVEVLARIIDLSDPAACAPLVHAAVERFGRLDALCNVAGIVIAANAHELPYEQWSKMIAINLTAPFLLCQAAIPHLIESRGAIVNCASAAGLMGQAYLTAYGASKHGLIGMTKSLAMEYIHQPIRINAVAPGGMNTGMGAAFRPPEGCDFELIKRYSGIRGQVDIDHVANMICLLASPAGASMHGTVVSVDGGATTG